MFCMQLAIKKARKAGIGWITCTRKYVCCVPSLFVCLCVMLPYYSLSDSNHYGIAGFYSQMATRSGLVGMSMTNASPLMMPTRGKKVHYN